MSEPQADPYAGLWRFLGIMFAILSPINLALAASNIWDPPENFGDHSIMWVQLLSSVIFAFLAVEFLRKARGKPTAEPDETE